MMVELTIRRKFMPFARRWQGWKRVLWWLNPIVWVLVETQRTGPCPPLRKERR